MHRATDTPASQPTERSGPWLRRGADAAGLSPAQSRSVVERCPVALCIVAAGAIAYANRAATTLLGPDSAAELVGRAPHSLLDAAAHAEFDRHCAAALEKPGSVGWLHAALAHGGPARHVDIGVAAVPEFDRDAVQLVLHDVTRRQRELRGLERSRQALRRLSANIVDGREAERQRIARELHDELGQSLMALKFTLDTSVAAQPSGPQRQRLQEMQDRVQSLVGSVRRIAADLRPLMLDELGPGPAIEWLVQDFARRTGLQCTLRLDDIGPWPDPQAAIALYRMVQESLTNVVRHARASHVQVELKRGSDEIFVRVCDDGIGMPVGGVQRDSQFGLLGMRERVDMLGGDLEIEAAEGGGTCVRMRVPLERGAAP